MKHEALLLLVLCSCVAEQAVSTETAPVRAYAGGKCPWADCGLNSPVLTDGFSAELNLDGLTNSEGFSIASTLKDGNRYKLNVVNGRMTASLELGHVNAPRFLSGSALVGAQIRLKRVVDGQTSYRRITIQSVSTSTDFWAKRTASTPKIETYRFWYSSEPQYPGQLTLGYYLCDNGQFLQPVGSAVSLMPLHHALVFEGDRFDVDTLTLKTPNARWFNIGCAETALAKMHLTGHTEAAKAAGYASTPNMRQAFLKMITASYCPGGETFTRPNQPLLWRNTTGTNTFPEEGPRRLEARWDHEGATCLDIPRLVENPPEGGLLDDLDAMIETACGAIPRCFGNDDPYYLSSYNPI